MTRDLRGDMRELIEREVMARAKVRGGDDTVVAPHAGASMPIAPAGGDGLEQDVLRLAADALRMRPEQIDPEENLANYGIDSIAITEVMAAISRFFAVSIAPTTFFEARHLKDLSQILRRRYGAAIEAHYAKPHAAKGIVPKQIPVAPRADRPDAAHPAPAVRRAQAGTAEPVAIIGLEGMFPKSADLAAFAAHLAAGDDCIEEIPAGRWDWRAVDGDPKRGPYSNVRHGGFVPGHDLFDAAFFKIPPNEAELMDPQHRLFLTCVWKLIEGAGHAPGSLAGRKVGLFLGINLQDYADLANRAGAVDPAQLTGLGHAFCANRLSYLLDIHGPSQVIDTACSSSLVALHRAVQCIRHEGCELAIAGGANLMLTPTQHILFSRVGMLAPDGRCKTFSRAANGYARAEGVGAVLLKRLDLAERDGDCILGLVRGSAENHGGAASSLTAPNPRAQARLILEAHRQAGIDPRSLGMIECHGTGTALGDPVEIEGLKAAFAELYAEHGLSIREASCGLGSVKSNIGHAETAAGIAGVIKVLLGLRAGRLWKTLHCEDPNPLIDLRGTPFYLMDSARDWPRPVIDGCELPRRAAVSSFGAGGANAHVVIEDYVSASREEAVAGPHVIVLSARTESALRDTACQLAAHLASDDAAEQALADIAFTLQTGRDAMRARLACVAHDKFELRAQLEAFVAHGAAAGVVTGTVARKGAPGLALPSIGTDDVDDDLARVAGQWVAGGAVDWAALHAGQTRRRVRLPTYPFQGKRYWLPVDGVAIARRGTGRGPLDLAETAPGRFTLQLSPDAFFLRDHVVGGTPTLPGVAYLELMRRAVKAAGLDGALGQIVWLKPLVVTRPVEIEVAIDLGSPGRPRIEVARVGGDGTRQVHAEARILPLAERPALSSVSADRDASQSRRYGAEHVYAIFDRMGLSYGPSHRAIVSLDCGSDEPGYPRVSGQLHLPPAAGPLTDFVLHPSLLDGAFQCALGTALDEDGAGSGGAALPFALDRIDVFAPCTREMTVSVRSSGASVRRIQKLDIDLMDADGMVCIRMSGFATRQLARAVPEKDEQATLLFAPDWQALSPETEATGRDCRRDAFLCGWSSSYAEALAAVLPGWSCRGFEIDGTALDGGFTACAEALLANAQMWGRAGRPAELCVIVPCNAPWLAGLQGLLKSVDLEVPSVTCRLLMTDAAVSPDDLAGEIAAASRCPKVSHVRAQNGAFLAPRWRTLERPAMASPHPWRDGGVYLITGGMGGLGRLFAREISRCVAGATLVLASRGATDVVLSPEWSSEFGGARVEIIALDVSDAVSVAAAIAGIRARHGRLDGVLHAAGLLDDGALAAKTAHSLRAVLAPKVAGTCHLDRVLGAEPLDLLLLFASLSGALGNPGQTDYAAANAFLDAFAIDREARRKAGLCHGRTLAVDWPVWREGGMRLAPQAEKLMTRTTGFTLLETEDAFSALYDALASGEPQVGVAAGDRARIEARFGMAASEQQPASGLDHETPTEAKSHVRNATVDASDLERAILPALMQIVSAQLKVAPDDLAPDLELTEYGYDSISFTQLANLLNDRFGLTLTPTVFFEHATLGKLAAYFARDHAPEFSSVLGVAAPTIPAAVASAPRPAERSTPAQRREQPRPDTRDAAGRAPIAIVGMSGVFPGAADPDALWQNLLAGRDATRALPEDRWSRQPVDTPQRGGFIDGIGDFDAAFFGLSAPEARLIDPQQRLLLTQTWRLLENAGYAPRALSGANIGVFVGIADTGYGRLVAEAGGPTEGYAMTGLAPSVGPNRVSFHFNFTGPSVAIETACSSALVAIHRAAEAIHSGDCEAAIAGGVNALLSPETFEGFARAGMLAADGRCKTFSADADGYGRGEGLGLVFLKRLADAERDGDRVLAVLRGSAENHGGRASTLTAPNPKAQAALLKQAYRRAGFDPRTVTYIEAHGTGTPLGDPIEVEALSAAFNVLSDEAEARFGPALRMACGIGSVKSNIGHLELAAGAAGLIKVLLMMRAGTLARSINCETLNPYLKLDDGVFRVVRETEAWVRARDAEGREVPRRAGVSSFGFGGSNAHLVLEEYAPADAAQPSMGRSGPFAIVLSARSEQQLGESAQHLLAALDAFSDADLASVAFTLQTCRDAMEHRLAFAASGISDVRRQLSAFLSGALDGDVRTSRVKAGRGILGLLDSDAEVLRALQGLPERGRQDLLLDLWVHGFSFDWLALYGAERPRRVALPGYPFARTVHWVRGVHSESAGSPAFHARALEGPSETAVAGHSEGGLAPAMLGRLTEIAARLLETDVDVLDPDTELGEFGLDSISMTAFAGKVNDALGLSLSPADFFEFATLARLAAHIENLGPRPLARGQAAHGAVSPAISPSTVSPSGVSPPDDDPVVIVGVSCCFPGAPDADAFWNNLAAGVDSIREIPSDRWDWRALHGDPKTEVGKTDIKFGGFIDGVFAFDPLFFGISPREALLMDPQQRLMMMHAWKALEDAGHDPRSLAGRAVGVFVGTAASGYSDLLSDGDTSGQAYAATGSASSIGPNRISYFFDWHGPSEPVETACSSSLVALHRAVQSLKSGECDVALAGGVNTIVTPEAHITFARAGMLSRDGACHTFSRNANGYVRGEGAGVVVLKRRSDALRDGDAIYAVARGTAVNHGGRANSLTAPNTAAQADVISRAYAVAGIDPSTVGYIEAHGTGTPLGDPVEINALKHVFAAREAGAEPCGLGSVKTNIGHLELAAGIAGVIKVLMQLRHRTLAPSLKSEPANPHIDFTGSPFFVVRERQPWPAMRDPDGRDLPRRAGVSSFGFGGVNAHVVLEEFVDRRSSQPRSDEPVIVPLSGRDALRLADQARLLREHLTKDRAGEISLADLAFTLQSGRTHLACRAAFVVGSLEALEVELDRFLAEKTPSAAGVAVSKSASIAPPAGATPQEIAAHWVSGGEVDWDRANPARRRLHLPTYPFAREIYKGGRAIERGTASAMVRSQALAPQAPAGGLGHDPDAFYFADHRIAGAPMLPGVMTLELARAASGHALPLSLGDIVWLKPVSASAGASARIAFDAGGHAFRLLSGDGEAEAVHAQGKLCASAEVAGILDVAAVRARCSRSRTPEWLYGAFEQLGMHYGPAFRSVTELACGIDEVLARLALPHAAARAGGDFTLHPSVMDGALQASLALYGEQRDGGTAIPFALDRVDVLRPTAREMWAHIRQRPSSGTIRKIDIDLADDSGAICVRLVGFSVRILPARDRPTVANNALCDAGARFFVQAIAAETAVPASQIALSASLDAYGIDSFMIVRLTDELEKTFGALPKTLFFEHRTLQAVVDYFVDNHGERLAEVTRTTAALGAARVRDRGLSEEPASTATVDPDAPIAVVGLAGRYPGARDLDGFWGNLVAGRDCITEVPLERWDRGRVSGALSSGAAWGGFIDGIAEFDPLFFNISPREAPFMDPQERLFLQCAHEAIEDSGNTRSGLARGGDVGVFVGVMWEEYQLYGVERTSAGDPLALSSSPASIANRVSSVCDFHGPSLAVDSMCSSSLSAIHLACESLRSGSCAAAIAGGVNLSLHPNKYRALEQGRFLSGSGRCESFGAGGDGYVPSEGVGAAVLKRLDRAIADGDQIYGVIRGSALNHGGKTNGYTVPNPQAQTAVIRRALAKADVAARDISYVEAHGTGTKLGDPIEIAALSAAYRADTSDTGYCRIGSVKSNIGHCESAAGIAGLTKVLLQMRNRQLVPSLHSETLNPGIDFDATPFSVQRRVETWERPAGARGRLAGLSSFGAGGSNAHLILEDHEASPDTAVHAGPFVFPFSARNDGVLENILRRFLAALDGLGDADLASAAFVLQQGREAFEQRVAIVAADRAELRSRLRDALSGDLRHVDKGTCRPGMSPAAELNPGSPYEIARAWADGATIEWARFWRGSRPRKISLPTYPFLREIYWVPGLVPPVGPASDAPAPFKPAEAAALPLLLTPDWQPRAAAPSSDLDSAVRRVVVFCGLAPCPIASAEVHALVVPAGDRFGCAADYVLQLIQSLVTSRSGPVLLQVVVVRDGSGDGLEGLGGLLRTSMHEVPELRCQMIAADAASHGSLAARLEEDARGRDNDIRYENGVRRVRQWREVAGSASRSPSSPWKDGGVYLITGGTGGLGLLLAERIASCARRPVLWLTSRTAPSRETQARLDRLDATVMHRRGDVTDSAAVAALIADIRRTSGRLDGIVQAAGITRDKRLVHKNARELREVLAPKVAGLAALDAASADCDLDVMLLFASASGALGNAGQADYAAANAFMDAFAEERNALVAQGRRHGHTLAIDWPFWRDGGMTMPQAAIDAAERASGVRPLATDAAFAALDAALAAARADGLSQILVLDGDRARLRAMLLEAPIASEVGAVEPLTGEGQEAGAVRAYLAERIATVLGVAAHRLDVHEGLDRYGLDSISGLKIVEALEASLGALPKTLLFEYPTLAKLAAALMETHGAALRALLRVPSPAEISPLRTASVSPAVVSAAVASDTDIAILAVAGRYPGAETPEALWDALSAGRDLVTEVPPDRWDIDEIYAEGAGVPGKSCCRWGGFLDDVARFDAGFFGISPRDARRMDPQERLLLETAWHLLERGGYPPRRIRDVLGGRVGVFAGSMSQQYRALGLHSEDRAALMLASQASLANRISHVFDFSGPSVAVDSMCSSGLEAIHLACQAMRRGECQMAIAGAVNLTLHPDKYVALSDAGLVGSHRGSRAFAGGDGYIPAEGVGAVLLKPLAAARASRDIVFGVIKGSAVNHSGRSAGYGVPSAEAQRQLIEDNFRATGIDPRTVGCVEVAASGSALGDAIEMRALARAFGGFTADTGFCALGSVKANMGHAEAASGLAQITKALFQLRTHTFAPFPVADIDPDLPIDGSPFFVPRESMPWTRMAPDQPLRAAISSFGAGGTNVHLILEEAPDALPEGLGAAGPWRFVLSAADEESLAAVVSDMAAYVAANVDVPLGRLAWTLDECRERLACAIEIEADSWRELCDALAAWLDGPRDVAASANGGARRSDQGSGPPLRLPDYPFKRVRHWITGSPVSAPPIAAASRDDAQRAPLSPRQLILETLAEQTGLSIEAIPARASFRDLGASSMFALRLIRRCADELGVSVTHRELAVHDSVDALADLIAARAPEARDLSTVVGMAGDPREAGLSEGQHGLWALQTLHPEMSTYNVPLAFCLARADPGALERAFADVLGRYPILSRRIEVVDGAPRVAVAPEVPSMHPVVMPHDADEMEFLRARVARPFDLFAAAPIRFELIRSAAHPEQAVVLFVVHHIAIDGVSAALLARAFWEAYACAVDGREPAVLSKAADFSEFVAFERAHLASAQGNAQLGYWTERLSDAPPVLDLPSDRAVDSTRAVMRSACVERVIGAELASAATAAACGLGADRPAFFLGALFALLHRYTGQEDICVGMPVMGRPARRFEESVGCFANMIVLRAEMSGAMAAGDVVADVQARLTDGLDHADVPFAAIARALGRTPQDGPLYQVSLAYQNFIALHSADGVAEPITSLRQEGGDALGFEIYEDGDGLRLVANFDTARFDAPRIARMLEHYLAIVEAMVRAPATRLSALDMLSDAERGRLLGPLATGGALAHPDGDVPGWIAATAERRPDAVALVVGARSLSFRELMERAECVASHLSERGVTAGDPVAVLMERGADAIIALLGVVRIGAVYVPLDGAQPDARLAAMLSDARAGAIVVDARNADRLAHAKIAVPVILDADRQQATARRPLRVDRPALDLDRAAYVIFTSGSTGRPKGVSVSHGALAHHCRAVIERFALTEDDRVLQFSALSVDPALEQILPALICGATVVMRDATLWTPRQLRHVMDRQRVTVADLPPAYLAEVLAEWGKSGDAPKHAPRLLICGGDVLAPETVRLWRDSALSGTRLINAYGPTETTITATAHEVGPDDAGAIPIGRPLPGTDVYILDAYGQLVPEGVPGELYVGGPRVAQGYIPDDEATRGRFIDNPYGNGRLFRTGDRVAFLPGRDGCLAFLGRFDSQVKIRGFRIELGEIDAALAACSKAQAAAVLCDGGLVGFVVQDEAHFDAQSLAASLAARLPSAMCPHVVFRIDALPLTPAGKVDRRALETVARSSGAAVAAPGSFAPPAGATEDRLAGLWREVLGVSAERMPIGRESDFFSCGGHSLLAVRLLSAIESTFGRRLHMADLLAAPTLAAQARRIAARAAETLTPGEPAVVVLRSGTGTPLFLVHPVGGGVSRYVGLARRLATPGPVYGIEAPEQMSDAPLPRVSERTARYLAAVRAIQPQGPYRLGGWSFGGIMAFDMARRLKAAGEEVAYLGLIDSYAPALLAAIDGGAGDSAADILDLFARDLAGAADITTLSGKGRFATIDELYRAPELASLLEGIDEARLRSRFEAFRANLLMARAYRPEPCAVSARLYLATSGHPNRSRGWGALVRGGFSVCEIPGDHYSILADPALAHLAGEVSRDLGACEGEPDVRTKPDKMLGRKSG